MKNTEAFPQWWHFDGNHGVLYCEVEEDGRKKFVREVARLVPSKQYEDAWMATTSNKKYILWKQQELVAGNELVDNIVNWSLRGKTNEEDDTEWTFNLYLALQSRLYWIKAPTQSSSITLEGEHVSSNIDFSDELRLLIPLEHDRAIAISERDRWYYLLDKPIDWADFEYEEVQRKKAAEKAEQRKMRSEKAASRRERRHNVLIMLDGLRRATWEAIKNCGRSQAKT